MVAVLKRVERERLTTGLRIREKMEAVGRQFDTKVVQRQCFAC